MLEELRIELYGDSCEHEETEDEKKERRDKEKEDTIRMLKAMGNKKE